MQKVLSLLIVSVITLSGCQRNTHAGGGDIIIDTQGVDMAQYHVDLYDCQQYADQVQVAGRTAKSAGAGAVAGGVLGAVVGNSNTAGKGAGVGAITGGLRGASSAMHEKQRVVRRCLGGRGYRVLN